ncbi:MAG: hypothetical protein HQL68_06980 [Magnetococcales bacterium]|nr:hypothetical protein [Magnetococcales bacterium]
MYNKPRKNESGALLISALIIMTIMAILAAGIARVQGSRADIVAQLASGYAMDDLTQTGVNIAMYEMATTVCHPEMISGAITDGVGRSTINRSVAEAGLLTISFCGADAECFTTDLGVAGKNVEWALKITSTIATKQKTRKLGINSDNTCNDSGGGGSNVNLHIAYWQQF